MQDRARIHVQAGGGGDGSLSFRREAHVPKGGLFPAQNGGDAAILFCFVFLYIAAAGPGPLAVNQR